MALETIRAGVRAIRARAARIMVLVAGLVILCTTGGGHAVTGTRAEFMIDPASGAVLHEMNADVRLHPASLTKMMTIYIAFEAARNGEFGFDAETIVSAKAAAETGSRLGLREGQRIRLRELVTATAVLSANDAATALAEAIGGSEAAFVARMNDTALRLGMTRSSFRNAHGLTAEGHLSTARDMSLLGLALLRDHPQFFGLFRQVRARAGGREIGHTNRLYLQSVEGADGIKTGYTRAAGFNLTASARRGDRRLIVTVMGARGSAERAARVAELMHVGFEKAGAVPDPRLAAGGTPGDVLDVPPLSAEPRRSGDNRQRPPPGPILAALQVGHGTWAGQVVEPHRGQGSIFATLTLGGAEGTAGPADTPEPPADRTDIAGDPRGQIDAAHHTPDRSPRPRARAVAPDAVAARKEAPVADESGAPSTTSSVMGVGLGGVGLGLFGQ